MPDSADFIEWDERYLMNIPFIDEQHKELVRLTNELYQGCLMGDDVARAYFMKTIKGIVDYVGKHFSMEEKMLENVHYPNLGAHKNQHEEFVKKILEDVNSFQNGKQFVPNVFVRYLKDWILSHIALEDKRYANYIFDLKKQGRLKAAMSPAKVN
ncbi:MAG: bacteriohemerythrin [Treponema sp.]|jgi:hemerythrin|nr:bacteriohemerythrin [Treponema sp.]